MILPMRPGAAVQNLGGPDGCLPPGGPGGLGGLGGPGGPGGPGGLVGPDDCLPPGW